MEVCFEPTIEVKKIVMPFHITHVADMDGVACALLTNIAIENLAYEKSVGEIHTFSGNPRDRVVVKEIRCLRYSNICVAEPTICPIGYTDRSREFLLKSLNEFSEILEALPKRAKVIPFFIMTDITVPDEALELISGIMAKYDTSFKWYFDHHATNPKANTWYSSDFTDVEIGPIMDEGSGSIYLPHDMECINSECKYKDIAMLVPLSDNRKVVERFARNDPYGITGPAMVHSSTWQYFVFLLTAGIIREYGRPEYEIDILTRFVYRIDIADTYAFDDDDIHLPAIFDTPDFYSCFMKSKTGFWEVYEEMRYSYKCNIGSYRKEGISEIDPMDCITSNAYGDGIFMQQVSWFSTMEYIAKRKKMFNKILRNSRVTHIDGICGFDPAHNVAMVIVTDELDISYTGNRIMKECEGIDYVIFMYAENRMILTRSRKGKVNLQPIMKYFGGGGHPAAAGATLDPTTFIQLLQVYWAVPYTDSCESVYIAQ